MNMACRTSCTVTPYGLFAWIGQGSGRRVQMMERCWMGGAVACWASSKEDIGTVGEEM